MSMMSVFLVLTFVFINGISCENYFDLNDVKVLKGSSDDYFGFALLLQTDTKRSRLVVGAPLNYNYVYECDPDSTFCKVAEMIDVGDSARNKQLNTSTFIGSVIDGPSTIDEYVTCAPRTIKDFFYTRGYCKHLVGFIPREDDRITLSNGYTGNSYYYAALGQAGFSLQYLGNSKILIGLPGFSSLNGEVSILDTTSFHVDRSYRNYENEAEHPDQYLGYSVTTAKSRSGKTYYIAGEPRGNNLIGQVLIFTTENNYQSLKGSQLGSYFGASVLGEDVTNDGSYDLFVSAPTTSLNQYDEGQVFFYKNFLDSSQFKPQILLNGQKPGSRFGTTMAKLGDIDLDGYKDVAISAPYEDGTGVIYIYRGSSKGPIFNERITPRSFTITNVKGFGLGISNGNDIDKNGHNDVAIGAFKSGQVFILKSKSVVTLTPKITTDIKIMTEDIKTVNLTYCLSYKYKSKLWDSKATLNFAINISLDYRFGLGTGTYLTKSIDLPAEKQICQNEVFTPSLKTNTDLSPFKITMKTGTQSTKTIVIQTDETLEYNIPYSHNCGTDNECTPHLNVEAFSNLNTITLGQHKTLTIDVQVSIFNESALQTDLVIKKNEEIDLITLTECAYNRDEIVCPLGNSFRKNKTISVGFNIENINPTQKSVSFLFKVGTSAKPDKTSKLETTLSIPVELVNHPFIQGSSDPSSFELGRDIDKMRFTQEYLVGNTGPSPLELDVHIYVPLLDGIFSISDKQISTTESSAECIESPDARKEFNFPTNSSDIAKNKTIVVDCISESCTHIICKKGYLFSSKTTETAVVKINFEVDSSALENRFKTKLLSKDGISYFTFASIQKIDTQFATIIYGHPDKSIPIWIYVVAASIGLLLLTLLIFGLYKLNFFSRMYRDKLNEEKLLDEHETGQSESMTDAVKMSDIENNEN